MIEPSAPPARRPIAAGLFLLLAIASTGCTSTQVLNVAASPDGNSVIAVGAKLRSNGFGWYYDGPLQWYCTRGADAALRCTPATYRLPKPS